MASGHFSVPSASTGDRRELSLFCRPLPRSVAGGGIDCIQQMIPSPDQTILDYSSSFMLSLVWHAALYAVVLHLRIRSGFPIETASPDHCLRFQPKEA
jgi:hypothetical protein